MPVTLNRLRAVVIGAALTSAVLPAAAQSREQRDSIEAFRDSLADVTDSVSLRILERQLIGHASHELRDSAMVHLRLGFVSMRLGDIIGREHYDTAAGEFQWATELRPKWPYGWFGLGLAELGFGDAQIAALRSLQTILGTDALARSANDFARSAEVDPTFVNGLVELANTALRQRVNARMDVALAALRRAGRTPAAKNPDLLVVRARIERVAGSIDSALAALDTLLERDRNNPAGLLEVARTRFVLGRLDGGDAWYRGLEYADSATLTLYRGDLEAVMPDSTLRAVLGAKASARVALARRFWERRDRDELHAPGERLEEHYRRLDYAERNYRRVSGDRHYDIIERYHPSQAELDDRGVIYVRQGPPDDRASLSLPGLASNETWVYHRPNGDLLFNFVAHNLVGDYRLVESVLDVLGFSNALQAGGRGAIQGNSVSGASVRLNQPPPTRQASEASLSRQQEAALSTTAEAMIRSREALSPIYSRMLTSGRGSATSLTAEERDIGRRSIAEGTTTDSWALRYSRALPAHLEILAVGSDAAGPQLQIAFAIPGSILSPATLPRGVVYQVEMRVSVLALDGSTLAAIDTVRGFVAANALTAHDFLLGRLPVHVPPGTSTVRVALETNGAGLVTRRDTVHVAAPLGPALGLSDLALGTRSVNLPWRAGRADTAWVNPLRTYSSKEPMQLYFEVTGLPSGTPYRAELAVTQPDAGSLVHKIGRLFGGGNGGLRLAFNETATGATQSVRREISLEKLKPGSYSLEVTVSTASGEKAVRRQGFVVVK